MGSRCTTQCGSRPCPRTAKSGLSASAQGFTRMTWNARLSWHQRAIIWVLRQGVIPRHAAIVPDGSRRYVKSTGIGLGSAYDIMLQKIALISIYMEAVGVEEVSYFVFSTRNFLRDTSEINAVLSAAVRFCKATLSSLDSLQRRHLRVSVLGDVDLLPRQLQSNMAQVEIATSNGSRKHTCRLCTAYSSKLSMNSTVLHMANAVRAGVIKSDDVTAELIWDLFAQTEACETDLWYRSSGKQCLIELLVLQSGYSYMHIGPQLWPATGFWEFVSAILQFQLYWPYIQAVKERHRKLDDPSTDMDPAITIRQRMFLSSVKLWRMTYIGKFCSRKVLEENGCFPKNHL
ncbi:dehydrodolichyl diphosphate synthase complex subunit DHDDS-like [Dermacentor albipictus]|uniref:dehydrodolichyl diphosphate synthase complex subunit DHDDS-like n=1 Tax=Dermacentor albipictus TaxID=60249 RepID=UPI0031FBBF37